MNYRHAFHAGNFADVFKHVILTRILLYLMRKDTPLRVIDTHAGEGRYDLSAAPAEKTAEWRSGVGRLATAHAPSEAKALLQPYLDIVAPLRAQPEFGRDPRVKILDIDGFAALKAFVPPIERRGLVLVDPPFEQRTEFTDLLAALGTAAGKWPTGVYMAWFPIKERAVVDGFLGALVAAMTQAGIKKLLRLELRVDTPRADGPLAANGLIILNPPHSLAVEARAVLPYLAQTMGMKARCGTDIAWLARDGLGPD